jgi:hypothetical protein
MHLQSVFPRAAVMAAIALLPLGACGASDPFPPAGLYEVRTNADIKYKGLDVSLAPLSNQSGTLMTSKAAGKGAQQRILKGEAVPTVCLAPHKPNTGIGMPAGSCKGKPAVTSPDGSTTFRVACGAMDMTTVVRKLDPKNWEYKVTTIEYVEGAGTAGKPDFATQKKMFEVTAKNGPTPEERAEAAKVLANWPAYEAEMTADMAEMAKEEAAEAKKSGAPAAAPKVLRTSTAVTRLTSLGGSCTPAAGTLPQGG